MRKLTKVKIFCDTDLSMLENNINDFIICLGMKCKVIDVKFNSRDRFSEAMIIYEKEV